MAPSTFTAVSGVDVSSTPPMNVASDDLELSFPLSTTSVSATPAAHFEVPTRESESDVDLFIGLWLHEGRREILGLAMDGNLRGRIYFKRQTRTGRIATAGPVGTWRAVGRNLHLEDFRCCEGAIFRYLIFVPSGHCELTMHGPRNRTVHWLGYVVFDKFLSIDTVAAALERTSLSSSPSLLPALTTTSCTDRLLPQPLIDNDQRSEELEEEWQLL